MRPGRRHNPPRRRGVVLLAVIVLVGVASLVAVSILKLAAARRETLRGELRQLQSDWLAESGLERAAARLAADPRYPGETWILDPETLGGRDAAVVRIEVQPVPGQAGRRLVRVRADYPDDARRRARRSKQRLIDVTL
jgi:type II secretory pathway component PulK